MDLKNCGDFAAWSWRPRSRGFAGLLVFGLRILVHLKGVPFGAVVMIARLLLRLLGLIVHLEGISFGAVAMLVVADT